jgi:hypothetical protein
LEGVHGHPHQQREKQQVHLWKATLRTHKTMTDYDNIKVKKWTKQQIHNGGRGGSDEYMKRNKGYESW